MDSFDMFIFNLNIFQFHKGTIKTLMLCLMYLLQRNFNSIKVRLKHCLASLSVLLQTYFNSIKVRLELYAELYLLFSMNYFNSIKVRLEHNPILPLETRKQFQFHKGTIRTVSAPATHGSCPRISIP